MAALTAGNQHLRRHPLGDRGWTHTRPRRPPHDRARRTGRRASGAPAGARWPRQNAGCRASWLPTCSTTCPSVEPMSRGARSISEPRSTELDTLLLFDVPGDARNPRSACACLAPAERVLIGEYRGYVVRTRSRGRRHGGLRRPFASGCAGPSRRPCTLVVPPPSHGSLPATFALAMRTGRLLTALERERCHRLDRRLSALLRGARYGCAGPCRLPRRHDRCRPRVRPGARRRTARRPCARSCETARARHARPGRCTSTPTRSCSVSSDSIRYSVPLARRRTALPHRHGRATRRTTRAARVVARRPARCSRSRRRR